MAVTAIRCVYQVSADVERDAGFYRDALGLAPRFIDGQRWAELSAGGQRFALGSPEEAAAGAAGAVIVFACDDLEAARAGIQAAGGRVTGERDMGAHGRTLTALDPSGQIFQLFERAATSA